MIESLFKFLVSCILYGIVGIGSLIMVGLLLALGVEIVRGVKERKK